MSIETHYAINMLYLTMALVLYFAIHSALAAMRLKSWLARHWPALMPAYRLVYNLLAVILLLPALWWAWRNPGPLLWQWPGIWSWLMDGLAALALIGFVLSLKSYDTQVFLGWHQWRARTRDSKDPEPLSLTGLHRFVRHPWYFFILVIIWSRDLTLTQTILYGLVSLYLVVGSRLEEAKLVAQFGEVYQRYRQQVAGLIPLPWRYLSRREAQALMQLASRQRQGEFKQQRATD